MERMLKPPDVAAILQVSLPIARKHMLAMPGVLSVGTGSKNALRVSEAGLKAWIAQMGQPVETHGKKPRKKNNTANCVTYDENGIIRFPRK